MHAVVVRVSIANIETAQKGLNELVVPRASQSPGFVTGHWTRSEAGDNGLSMIIFDSEDAARAASERIGTNVPEGVGLESVEVREVVAHA
jgi:hypothetical protein